MRTAPVKIICTATVMRLVETPASLVSGVQKVLEVIVLVVIEISLTFKGLKFETNREDKQKWIWPQQAVDSSHYLPRTVCLEISRQVSWLMRVKQRLPKNQHCVNFQWLIFLSFPITVTRIASEPHGIPFYSVQKSNICFYLRNTLNVVSLTHPL